MLTFSGMALDRAVAERLDPQWVARRIEDPASRAVVASADGVLATSDPPVSLLRVPMPAGANGAADAAWPVLLGIDHDDVALFAVDFDVQPPDGATAPH